MNSALVIAREIGNRSSEAADITGIANRFSYLGNSNKAIEYYEQALTIAREIGTVEVKEQLE